MKSLQPKNITPTHVNDTPFFQKRSRQSFFGERSSAFFYHNSIQPKLTVNQPNDQYEKEADVMADKVVQRLSENKSPSENQNPIQAKPIAPVTFLAPPVQTKCAACEQEEQLQKKDEEEREPLEDKLQRKPIFESNALPPEEETVQRKCAACEQEEKLQKKEGSASEATASPSIESSLAASNGSGSPLPAATREQMESSFGADFSDVRIHNDSSAVQMNKNLNAQAFTHGSDIYFNSGKYDTNSTSGKHLLAHELTHTMQQGASGSVQTKSSKIPDIQCVAILGPLIWWGGRYVAGRLIRRGIEELLESDDESVPMRRIFLRSIASVPIDIKGMSDFTPPPLVAEFIKEYATTAEVLKDQGLLPDNVIQDLAKGPKLNLRYGDQGEIKQARIRWDTTIGAYQMEPYQMMLSHPLFDFSQSTDTLGMQVKINSGKIEGEVGFANREGLIRKILETRIKDSPSLFQFDFELFKKAVLGEEASDTSNDWMYGFLSNGYIQLWYSGLANIPNKHAINATLDIKDKENKAEWKGALDLDVMGMQPYTLAIDRTSKGLLSGMNKDNKITLDKTFAKKGTDADDEKGFELTTKVTASYLNKVLTIKGEATYNSSRAQGNLILMVTDYSTAKQHAIQFLPDEIAEKAKTDEPPPNPTERLAFMGAGNLHFTLFDGNKEERKKKKQSKQEFIGEEPPQQPNLALQAEASFVVEPEGYITIAGQVKPIQEEFILFDAWKYEKEVELLEIPIFKIPGPLATSADFNFSVKLGYGAKIGPLTLSEIIAEGVYSNRPDALSELQLSGLIKLPGEMFVKLKFCLEVEGSILGVFDVTLVEACIEAGVGIAGAVQARPTIQIGKLANINTPPEYFIRGDFHFDAGGKIFLFIGDSLRINLSEKDTTKTDPSDWRYKNSQEVAKKEFGSRDVEVPMDHTLGSKEIPRVSFRQFAKERLKALLTNLITADRPRKKENVDKYFEPGKATGGGGGAAPPGESEFRSGGFEEGREEKGKLADETKPKTTSDKEAKFVFEETFTMMGAPHKLFLVVTQSEQGGKPKIDAVVMMESELEELSEKIEEERKEIGGTNDVPANLQEADLSGIEAQSNEVKEDARKLGVNNELSNQSEFPALKQTAASIQNYASRYEKNDLGQEDLTLQPDCPEPKNVHPGDLIIFRNYTGGENTGFVIQVVAITSFNKFKNKKEAFWHIRFKPKSGRKTTSLAPKAYDENCSPTYIIPKIAGNCEEIKIQHNEKIVPARTVNKKTYPQRRKASWVKAYPLCWGEELKPRDQLAGLDRIDRKKEAKWVRAHLVHAKMGGRGSNWNLVPVPEYINLSTIKMEYETKVIELVQDGLVNGKQYWFEAKVVYHQGSDHPVIGHYEDFVKEIRISYGEVIDKGDGKWDFPLIDSRIVQVGDTPYGKTPSVSDLSPDRIQG